MKHSIQKAFDILLVALFTFAIFLTARVALAVEPGWYAPLDGSGQAMHIRCNDAERCVISWETYAGEHGQVFLVSEGLCKRGEAVCEDALQRTAGSFDGITGDAERLPAEAFIALIQEPGAVLVEWDVILLRPGACRNPDGSLLGSGGLLLRRCIQTHGKRFFLLAQ